MGKRFSTPLALFSLFFVLSAHAGYEHGNGIFVRTAKTPLPFEFVANPEEYVDPQETLEDLSRCLARAEDANHSQECQEKFEDEYRSRF